MLNKNLIQKGQFNSKYFLQVGSDLSFNELQNLCSNCWITINDRFFIIKKLRTSLTNYRR